MHIITGLGRSGTSFIAEIINACGIDVGGDYNKEIDAGFEHPDVTRLNKIIISGDYWHTEEQKQELRVISQDVQVAKDPRFVFTIGTWLLAGANIDSVYFCERAYKEIFESSNRTWAGSMAILNGMDYGNWLTIAQGLTYAFFEIIDRYAIPRHEISYPESLHNFNKIYSLRALDISEDKLKEAWGKVRRIPKEGPKGTAM